MQKRRFVFVFIFLIIAGCFSFSLQLGGLKSVQAAGNLQKTEITTSKKRADGVLLKWKKVPNAKGYYIYRNKKKIAVVKSGSTVTYTDKQVLTGGSKYVYTVCPYTKSGGKTVLGPKSAGKTFYYLNENAIDIAYRKNDTTTVKWTKSKGASGYQVEYSVNADFSNAKKKTLSGTSLSRTLSGLSMKNSYYVRVRAYKKTSAATSFSLWSKPCRILAWNSSWTYAGNSAIHTDSATLYFSSSKSPKGKTVCVNAGHGTVGGSSVMTLCHPDGSAKVTGGSTAEGAVKATAVSSGTVLSDGTPEANANLALAKLLKQKLLEEGYDVLMIRENSDVQLDNIARTLLANHYADCHIALHYDSTSNDKGAFFISVPNVTSYRNMYPVSKFWKSHMALGNSLIDGMKTAGVKIYSSGALEIDLTQTSYSMVPSVDLEVGDCGSDHSEVTQGKIADGIVIGLNSFFK